MAGHDAATSFETKWSAVYPELALGLRFVNPAQRAARSALACIGCEIAHAAFRVREPQVAATKLQWWADELGGLPRGHARHPLTQLLAAHAPVAELAESLWQQWPAAALIQREAQPASTLDALLEGYLGFERIPVTLEARLFGDRAVEVSARARMLTRALHETILLEDALGNGRLAVPLDLLARFQLARGNLAVDSAERNAALRAQFGTLARMLGDCASALRSPLVIAATQADARRSLRAARASQPLHVAARERARIDLATVWATWRGVRRMALP